MKRVLLTGSFVVVLLAACQLPPERESLKLLPDDRPTPPFAELLTRARGQATLATEAYYTDRWADLEEAARGLEQSAQFLSKATDVPPAHKAALPKTSESLAKEAALLREGAKAKDIMKVKETLTRIHSMVREMRLDQ